MNSLEVTDVVKGYDRHPVLTGLSLEVAAGTITAILGPSGSGKSTLLRLICGFDRAERGSISLDGEVVDDPTHFVPPNRRRIGYVPQEGNLFPHLSVMGNVRFGLPRGPAAKRRASELLEMVGLAGRARSYPSQLSGGQQQRVALARALAVQPRLVLLDEPFASLDASLRATVRADVVRVLRDAGATALLVTHDQDEALSVSDRVAVIRDGVIAQLDSPHRLYAHPIDAELAASIGDVNLIDGQLNAHSVATELGRLTLAGTAVTTPQHEGSDGTTAATVLIRAEQVMLSPAATGEPSDWEVIDQEFYGHDAIVRIRTTRSDRAIELVARVRGAADWPPGSHPAVTIDGPVIAWPGQPGQQGQRSSSQP